MGLSCFTACGSPSYGDLLCSTLAAKASYSGWTANKQWVRDAGTLSHPWLLCMNQVRSWFKFGSATLDPDDVPRLELVCAKMVSCISQTPLEWEWRTVASLRQTDVVATLPMGSTDIGIPPSLLRERMLDSHGRPT